ncbi:tripartite tricarboxylate transporter TctB family protein [Natrialbaceae archaeon A-chndr2]
MQTQSKLINGENALVVIFLIAGLYGFIEADNFSSAAATFPRLVSGIIIAIGTLLLFKNFLPEEIQSMIFKESSLGQNANDSLQQDETDTISSEMDDESTEEKDPKLKNVYTDDRFIITILGFGFMVTGYLIGLLWATPIFMLSYMVSQRQPWHITLIMVLIGTGIMYGFQWGIGLQLDQGVLL